LSLQVYVPHKISKNYYIKMTLNIFQQIAQVLLEKGNRKCLAKAADLNNDSVQSKSLHLRELDLNSKDVISIANVLQLDTNLTSISFSHNPIGDLGAVALATSFPKSVREIGMEGCRIGDKGGGAILELAKSTPSLQMICIAQNNFSATLKKEFLEFSKARPNAMIVT
jgi:hypothetical protein